MGSVKTSFLGAFVLWWLSTSLLRVRAEVTISKPLSQDREIAGCSSVSSPGHTNSVSVCAAKTTASWVVYPTAALPALVPGPGMSLPFVLLKPPAAPSSHACPHSSRFQSRGLP